MSTTIGSKIQNMSLILLGATILVINILLYYWNIFAFNIFTALYIIGFAVYVIIMLWKYQKVFEDSKFSYDFLTYMSMYTILLESILILIIIGFAIVRRNKKY